MSRAIELRVIAYSRRGVLRGICLETDIAVEAGSLPELQQKFEDALGLYFASFSREELARGEYRRPAPVVYQLMWKFRFIPQFVRHWMERILQAMNAEYDPTSNQVKLCLA